MKDLLHKITRILFLDSLSLLHSAFFCVQKPLEMNVYSPDHGSLICPLQPNLGRISGGVQAVGYNWT